MNLYNENPWKGILSSILFAIWSMVQNNKWHTPSQLEFGMDTILNINQEARQSLVNVSFEIHWR